MSTVDECIHLMTPEQCTICNGRDATAKAAERAERDSSSRPFAARYPGHCGACNFPIHVGQPLVIRAERAIHEECAA